KTAERLVLLIKKTNFEGIDYELTLRRRQGFIGDGPPADSLGQAPLKPHQIDGFQWLVQALKAGWSGRLLAAGHGLGKTVRARACLAWIKRNGETARARGVGSVSGRPLLIAAPTALLKNWEKECADRLSLHGLGNRIDAYGSALRRLRLDPSSRQDPGET